MPKGKGLPKKYAKMGFKKAGKPTKPNNAKPHPKGDPQPVKVKQERPHEGHLCRKEKIKEVIEWREKQKCPIQV